MSQNQPALKLGPKRLSQLNFIKQNKKGFGKDITNMAIKSKKQIANQYRNIKNSYKNRSLSISVQHNSYLLNGLARRKDYDIYNEQIVGQMLRHQKINKFTNKNNAWFQLHGRNLGCSISKLVTIQTALGLKQQTLYLSFSYLREFLNNKIADQSELPLAAITCMWIASKYEQIYPPRPKYFIKFASKCDLAAMTKMESQILETIKFGLVRTTPFHFLQLICGQESNIFCLSNYLIQCLYLNKLNFQYSPSLVAYTASQIANKLYKKTCYSTLEKKLDFTKQQFYECYKNISHFLNSQSISNIALSKKFQDNKMYQVSKQSNNYK